MEEQPLQTYNSTSGFKPFITLFIFILQIYNVAQYWKKSENRHVLFDDSFPRYQVCSISVDVDREKELANFSRVFLFS